MPPDPASTTQPVPPGLPSALQGVTAVTFPGVAADFAGYLLGHLGATVRSVVQRDADGAGPAFDLAYRTGRPQVPARLPEAVESGALNPLLAEADIVITDSVLSGRSPVGYRTLAGLNPAVVHAEISTFGNSGPAAGRPGGDLVATAGSGFLQLTGTPGEAPVRMGADQALKLGGAEAVAGIMVALHHRGRTGAGQHVDVSVRDAMVRATVNAIPKYRYEGLVQDRVGDHWGVRDRPLKALWECADGWVSFVRRGGILGGRVNHATVEWMQEYGMDTGDLADTDWDAMDLGVPAHRERLDRLDDVFAAFLRGRCTEDVFEEGLQRGITLAPVRSLQDVLAERHFVERDYWASTGAPGGPIRVPGYLVKSVTAPAVTETGTTDPGAAGVVAGTSAHSRRNTHV